MDRSTSLKRSRAELPWKLIYLLRGGVVLVASILVVSLWLVSRVDRSEIKTYTVPLPVDSRMLAAIVPYEHKAWFFKMLGSAQPVASQREAFNQLIKSIRFDPQESEPSWTLPSGWRQLPADAPQNTGTFKRFATLEVSVSGEKLETSVTNLPYDSTEGDAYLLANINRWRQQLKLRDLDLQQLAGRTETIELDGVSATLIDIAGKRPAQSMASPPAASGPSVASSSTAPANSRKPPAFSAPDEWSPGGATSMSLASFQVQQDDQRINVTVTPLPPSDLLANVNRWRSQIALEQIDQDELDQLVSKIKLGEVEGDYVALQSPEKTILGVIAVHNDMAWFIKLMGDSQLAQRERERFEDFVRSFQFN